MFKKLGAIVLISSTSLSAFADQCAWNKYTTAAAGRELIKNLAAVNNQDPSVLVYCEPCGDTEMLRAYLLKKTTPVSGNQNEYDMTVTKVGDDQSPMPLQEAAPNKVHSKRAGYWQLNLWQNKNHHSNIAVDLACTYVKVAKDRYVNVALAVGCPADGVSPIIITDGDKQTSRKDVDEKGNEVVETDDGILIRDRNNPLRGEG